MATALIVDDASFMRNALKYILESAGHQVVGTAADGEEALALYGRLHPELVTLDILMPGLEGLSVLKILKESDPASRVIMVTAVGREQEEQKARRLGASGYIRKPFKQQDVIEEVEKVLNSHKASRKKTV